MMEETDTRLLLVGGEEALRLCRGALDAHAGAIELSHAVDHAEVERALRNGAPDVILAELACGDITALELAGLCETLGLADRLVLLVEHGGEETALACLSAGIDQFLPLNPESLRRLPVLIDLLRRRRIEASARKRIEEELHESRERYLDVFDNTSDLIQCLAPDGSFLYVNRAWRETMGYTEEEVKRLNLLDVLHPDSMICCQDRFRRLKQGETLNRIDFKFVTKDGETVHLEGDCGSIFKDGRPISTRGIFRNVTDTIRAERALRLSEARYQALYENAPDIYTTIDAEGVILSINKVGADMLGYEPAELIGQSATLVIHPEDQARVLEHIAGRLRNTQPDEGIEYRKLRKDGSVLWVHQRASLDPAADDNPRLLVICRDITDRRELEERLAYQATHDGLTGLINRREFERRLRLLAQRENHADQLHVLCYLDLDNFKAVNDSCGHLAGDELLRRVSALLSAQVRTRDMLARVGGDEFALLLENASLEEAQALAERMRETVEKFRFQWHARQFSIGVSIGMVPFHCGVAFEVLLSHADSACYTAKERGRNCIYVYPVERGLEKAAPAGDMQWAPRLTAALDADGFRLYAQPMQAVGEDDGRRRLEILLRLPENGPDEGEVILPGAFMSAAERYRLAIPIDRWVLRRVVDWFGRHRECLEETELCAVNLSAAAIADEGFVDFVLGLLDSSGFPARKLCFEISESVATSDLVRSTQFMQAVKARGCRIALDDFGSGLSSFVLLQELPVDMVKIDGSFVRRITDSEVDRTMVRSVRDIAASLGKQTVAEHVESAATATMLESMGVDLLQGFHIARPRPLAALFEQTADDVRVVPFTAH
ncbi:bifunctional diguanylate cyclase/phosphodiesterase [Thiohalobacter sp.]|uniref:bifunctional diguanylate cyclase/phosphodiesterase n=1 Tax=Thiohalobacter sp. TaxID=2025948 RepID=UPI002609203E|nr:bifunctional diguanylate cyclase/phosphodiesterase [Thiohalobacter sp.]